MKMNSRQPNVDMTAKGIAMSREPDIAMLNMHCESN